MAITTDPDVRINETPATTKRKIQMWFGIAFGIVLVVLIAMTVINVVKKLSERDSADQTTTEADDGKLGNTKQSSQSDFEELVRARRGNRADPQPPLVGPTSDVAPTPGAQPGSMTQAATGSTSNDPLQKWAVQEQLRALTSAQAKWVAGTRASGSSRTAAGGVGAPPAAVGPAAQGEESLEQKRASVRSRIEQAQRLRQQLQQGQANANIAPVQSELVSLQQSFTPAPVDVAGYTKENSYNADIAGKVKLPPGTIIPVENIGKSISDYTGPVRMQVTRDVYDSRHENVVIPKGSTGVLRSVQVQNVNEPIQSRMGFTVGSIVLPDDRIVDLSKAASLVDREGIAAIKDQTQRHYMAQFLGVAAYALIAGGTSYQGTGISNDSDYAGEVGREARSQFAPLAQKYLSLVPTITINSGQSMNIILETEVYIEPWKSVYASYVN